MAKNTPEYMREYYLKNKERIINKLKEKCICEYCNRSVCHQNMIKHMESDYCLRRRKIKEGSIISKINEKTEQI
jgi:hypothetical protein